MLISVTSMVIISQQHFLYNPAIFIPMNAKSIPTPTRQPPQTNILISQYPIPATTGLDIPSLICATFFTVSTIQPAMVCIKVAIVSKNLPQSEINTFDRIIWKRVVDAEYHISRNINASYTPLSAWDRTDVWNCQAHSALSAGQLRNDWTDLRISIFTSCDTPTQATSSQTELPQKMCRNC